MEKLFPTRLVRHFNTVYSVGYTELDEKNKKIVSRLEEDYIFIK